MSAWAQCAVAGPRRPPLARPPGPGHQLDPALIANLRARYDATLGRHLRREANRQRLTLRDRHWVRKARFRPNLARIQAWYECSLGHSRSAIMWREGRR